MTSTSITIEVSAGSSLKDAWRDCYRLKQKTGLDSHFKFNGIPCFFHGQSWPDFERAFKVEQEATDLRITSDNALAAAIQRDVAEFERQQEVLKRVIAASLAVSDKKRFAKMLTEVAFATGIKPNDIRGMDASLMVAKIFRYRLTRQWEYEG